VKFFGVCVMTSVHADCTYDPVVEGCCTYDPVVEGCGA
jgi:hypothetical protein